MYKINITYSNRFSASFMCKGLQDKNTCIKLYETGYAYKSWMICMITIVVVLGGYEVLELFYTLFNIAFCKALVIVLFIFFISACLILACLPAYRTIVAFSYLWIVAGFYLGVCRKLPDTESDHLPEFGKHQLSFFMGDPLANPKPWHRKMKLR